MDNIFDELFHEFANDFYRIFRRADSSKAAYLNEILQDILEIKEDEDRRYNRNKRKSFDNFFSDELNDFFGESFYQDSFTKNKRSGKNKYRNKYSYSGKKEAYREKRGNSIPYNDRIASYYGILHLDYGSKMNAVKTAWKAMCKQYHPDFFNDNPDIQKRNTKIIQKCTEAYKEIEKFLRKYDSKNQ